MLHILNCHSHVYFIDARRFVLTDPEPSPTTDGTILNGDRHSADVSFRLRRNLLRRRHVRKEQKQKSQERAAAQQQQKALEERKQLEQSERTVPLSSGTKRRMPCETSSGGNKRERWLSAGSGNDARMLLPQQHRPSPGGAGGVGTNHPDLPDLPPIGTPTKSETTTRDGDSEGAERMPVASAVLSPEFSPIRPNRLRELRRRIL